ncbi:anthocyanidin 3-O-glucosyltransferase 2-like isoform X2 [Magnolia sinica]|uniref:anthocyanidin 3-O-glucosyltransferase 2-like isoform X2 n=1 Tax=Magnolia sinica TaxID=86752 RepID=UPI002658D8D4|nr:anthocyanidin 3-O-glucosyltransferase 2-like isoform X2 [Magnolia sinica]
MEEVTLAFLPLPGKGHLTSAVELAKRLVKQKPFSITILMMRFPEPDTDAYIAYIKSVAASGLNIRFVDLPTIQIPPSLESQGPLTFLPLFIESHKPLVKDAITKIRASTKTRVAALIIDFFVTTMIDVTMELGIPAYIYFPSGTDLLALMLYLPILHTQIPCEFHEYQGEIEIPGMQPLPPNIMPTAVMNKKKEMYTWFVHHGRRFRETQGIIINTFAKLQPTALEAVADGRCLPDHATPPIYPVGPLIRLDDKSQSKSSGLIEWLDQQPHASVVFLCFGSMGAFAPPQVKEMALGLEKSGHRFLWSLRCPSSENPTMPVDAHLDQVLPDGFLDRTKGWGLVWPSWVPQIAILAHPAVGGFVSHCGWNSILESLWFGVPILAWPLYAEQRLNAFQLVKDYGLAVELRLDFDGDGLVSAEELERGVRCLMEDSEEGMKVRKRMKEMGEASRNSVKDGGSSFASLERLADLPSHGSTFPKTDEIARWSHEHLNMVEL